MSSARRQPMLEMQSEVDLHQLLVPTPTKDFHLHRDTASASSGPSSDAGSFVIPETLSRSNSVYSFSRASFSSQISSLTSMSLPPADTLAASIKSLPSSRKAVKTLNAAADQIQLWTKKALKVLENLDADEDVEWAAAAGRDGLDETSKTVNKFENLVNVYVVSIEELQTRPDIGDVKAEGLQGVVEQMEIVLMGWENVRKSLKKVHDQVELAMEWEELWSTVLGEVGNELASLSQLVFDMEEKRHAAYQTDTKAEPHQNIDLNELESFIDEPKSKKESARFSLPPGFEASPLGSPVIENPTDDSNLLALFARMQPLRASLDFLPMRLSMFQTRAANIFPSACQELEDKKERLERNWGELSKEADNLRKELSEDRWVIVFRNAGRQANKMCESVERSIAKVNEAINEGFQRSNPATLAKRIESFEAKKMHYSPAIQRVLGIIQKGLKDRLTVNGEILRLNKDLSTRLRDMTDAMQDLESLLEPVTSKQNSRLRESISSIISADRSFSSTTMAGTPGSSPASSVDFGAAHHTGKPTPKYGLNGYSKPRAPSSSRPPLVSNNRRSSMMPQNRRPTTPLSAASTTNISRRAASPAPGPPSVYRQGVYAPPKAQTPRPGPAPVPSKPRWSSTVRLDEETLAPTYRDSHSVTPGPYRKAYTPRSISSTTALPLRSPLGRESSSSPLPATAHKDDDRYRSFAERVASPPPNRGVGILDPPPYHRNRNVSAPQPGTIRSPSSMAIHNNNNNTSSNKPIVSSIPHPLARPPSSLNRSPRMPLPQRMSSLNARLEQPATPHRYTASADSSIPESLNDADLENRSDAEADEDEDESHDQLISEPGSSPLSRKTVTRPGSVLSGRGGGSSGGGGGGAGSKAKRMSMLPLPVGGRTSSLGFR